MSTPSDLARNLVNAMPSAAWLQQDDHPLHANDALLRLVGHPPDDLLNLPSSQLVAPTDREAFLNATHDCLHGSGEPPAQSLTLLTRDHSTRPVELTLRRIDLDGRPTALITCHDLSDFHHVQNSLQTMSGLLRQIIDGAPVASFVIDAQHHVTHWNSACEQLTDHAAHEMIGGTDTWKAFYDEERPLLADLIVSGATEGELLQLFDHQVKPSPLLDGAYEVETFFPNLGPHGRWLHYTAAPLRNEAGDIIGAVETLQDVSQRRRAEQELTQHRNQLEQLVEARSVELAASVRELKTFIDNAPIGVAYTVQGRVLRCNQALSKIFGLEPEAVTGMATRDLFLSPGDHEALSHVAAPLLSRGMPLHHEMWMKHSSGRPIWIQQSAYVSDHQNTAAGTWWMLQDRTEMRSAQEELRTRFSQLQDINRQLEEAQNQLLQSDKMASIGQLAAGIAHEINNPVGFVTSNLHTLRGYVTELFGLVEAHERATQAPQDESARAALSEMRATVELAYLREDLPQLLDECADGLGRVRKIVQDLKDFSRVDQADWQEADLNAGLQSTLNVVRHEVKYKAEVLLEMQPLPPVLCLAAQLNQVFLNLIVNASQAIRERGTLRIATGVAGHCSEWAWVEISDDGCGMTEDVMRRIFEPFFTTKEVGKGTGLGLSLSFSIVQKHGGTIQVKSTVGVGSTFRVWVPVGGPHSVPAGLQSLPEWPESDGQNRPY